MQPQLYDKVPSTTPRGYVALLVVLIVASIGSVFAFSSLSLGGDSATSTLVLQESLEAHTYADACAELGLIEITANDSFSGSGGDSFAQGTCEFSVTFVGPTESIVESEGIAGDVVRKVLVDVTTKQVVSGTSTTTAITAATWTEPADF